MNATNQQIHSSITILGLVVVVGLGIATMLFPLYDMRDGTWLRRPLWDPPSLDIARPTDNLSIADRERLVADPHQRQILESLDQLPDSFFQPKPDWLGWSRPNNRTFAIRTQRLPANGLLAATILAVGAYGFYLWSRLR